MKWIKKVATTPLDVMAKVIDSIQAQTNDTTNAPSINAVRNGINNAWDKIYPIGSIYMCVNDINPSEIFGGTWVQIKDRFLLAAGDTYSNGATGGSATHTPSGTVNGHALTVNEMPSHNHTYGIPTISLAYANDPSGTQVYAEYHEGIPTTNTGGGQKHSHTFTGTSQDTMPPYLAVKVWKRTA